MDLEECDLLHPDTVYNVPSNAIVLECAKHDKKAERQAVLTTPMR